MAKVVLFPQIASSLEWLKRYNSSVWLERDCRLYSLFIGRVVSTLLSKGIEKILLRRRVDITLSISLPPWCAISRWRLRPSPRLAV
jgi:hypothetical protein